MGDDFSAKEELGLVSHNDVFFFVSRHGNDLAVGEYLTLFDTYIRRVSPDRALHIDAADWVHGNIIKFMNAIYQLAEVTGETEELRELQTISREHMAYLSRKCEEFGIGKVADWLHGIHIASGHPDARRVLLDVVHETIDHLIEFALQKGAVPIRDQKLSLARMAPGGHHAKSVIENFVPRSVLEFWTETTLPVIRPWFEQSLAVPGDIAEFGCYKGTLSIKYAFYVGALEQSKTVYAFDTFEGFTIADPGGGALGIGAYDNNDNAYDELKKWSRILPLVPVKGDARETCKILKAPLSFVWLDLDMAVLMEPVFDYITNLCTRETVLGVDDYGRPETPTVKPWADELERHGVWRKLREYPHSHIAFYQKCA